jgi:hypothetical protein
MAKLTMKEIVELGRKIIAESPEGIRYAELVRRISKTSPENARTIPAGIWNLHRKFPQEIAKPSRGLFMPVGAVPPPVPPVDTGGSPRQAYTVNDESDFYGSFAEWLKTDLGEVTEVAPLGGAAMGRKWGTPDVVGVYKPEAGDLVKFQPEIVSAEIKIDPQQPVVAFGQAIAYRLFSSKTYIAMPNSMIPEDHDRLESLCMLFGVGMVLFELNPKEPHFVIRVRARRFSPDMFYVNEFAERLKGANAELFRRLF